MLSCCWVTIQYSITCNTRQLQGPSEILGFPEGRIITSHTNHINVLPRAGLNMHNICADLFYIPLVYLVLLTSAIDDHALEYTQ